MGTRAKLPVRVGVALRWLAVGLVGLLWAASGARAQAEAAGGEHDGDPFVGSFFVRGEDGVSLPAVALNTDVEILVSGLMARVRVSQQFHNDSDLWVEGIYVFPLPEMAAVDRMLLQVGERRIEGRIQERAQAKRSYAKAKREGKTASLLEQERPNLFTTSVANVGPGERVQISIEYQHTLHYEGGGFELRFPMTLTARYVPGGSPGVEAPLPPQQLLSPNGMGWSTATTVVPDAARITPWMIHPDSSFENPLTLRVELDAGFPLSELVSPSHPIEKTTQGQGRHEVWLRDVPADRDFVLRWTPQPAHEPRAAIFSEPREGDHYALLMLLPPDDDAAATRPPREAIYVIDTSGSMAGASIEQARASLHLALDRLAPEDTFNVVAFDSGTRPLFRSSQPATAGSLQQAHDFVGRLGAGGGTEMLAAMQFALLDRGEQDSRLRQVVFITDGSVGNEAELFEAIEHGIGRSRLFMVGIGSAPNAYFLNRAAVFGRGTVTAIGSQTELQERMQALFQKIESPVLTDLELHWNDPVEMWPQRVPDLYAGEPVVVTARLQRFVGELRLTGRRGDRPFELRLPLTPGAPERGLHKLWARRKIAHWMGQRGAGVPQDRIRDEVLAVALEHQLVSKFTSLVAVDVTPRRPAGTPGAATGVPNHGPAGFDPQLVPGVLPRGATSAPALLWIGSTAMLLCLGLWRAERKGA
jgi:Ca-activated chloride channel family protein